MILSYCHTIILLYCHTVIHDAITTSSWIVRWLVVFAASVLAFDAVVLLWVVIVAAGARARSET